MGLLSGFTNNNIFTLPYTGQQGIPAENGTPPGITQTVDFPSGAGWMKRPTQSSYGGIFYVACC